MAKNIADAEAIEAWLVSKLSERLGIESHEIDIREPLASYGLGSTEAVSLAGELAEWLGRELPPALVYEYPTILALSRYLAGAPDAPPTSGDAGPGQDATNESIAIIGIGCRFPGASGPAAFWRLLRDGVDAIREVPADRFDADAFYDPDPATPGKINTRWGGFLDAVDQFDARFFGISPREAARMDPQQRLLLEVTWEALQDAGQVPERLAGTQVGVFIGIATNDYGRMQFNDLDRIDAYTGTGNALSIAANRISYNFDFRGPSLAIDTACSSSLVAVHLACSSLRSGEATLALAGGVNLIFSPAIAINFTKAGAMAPDGRCKSFDARANGYVRSEGAGIVVLKPLSKAMADGDPVYAVIRGSAVNQDGRSNGLMAPNPLAQEAVLREAYRQAAVSPGQVHYVEAHGTGTLLGDPIEAKALGNVLSIDRPPGRPCALGSVKSNLGHLEAAAGVAGLIKVALAIRHREIPPSLHFEVPNPHIPFDELPLRVQTALNPWPAESGPALAGVSSFGFGGTNAHVVLEEAPVPFVAATAVPESESAAHLLPLSARGPEALRALAHEHRSLLGDPEARKSLADICYTASRRLGHHDHRLAIAGESPGQLIESLDAFLRSETRIGLSTGRKHSSHRRKLVFVFSGQGSQWFGMGRRLLEREPVFLRTIEECDQAMRPYRDWSLLEELSAVDTGESRLAQVDVVQPVLFAIQVGLAALWRSWGIEPQAVVGHSLGEVAAAHVAGALSLDDAVRVVCQRSRLFMRAVGQGTMAAVELSIEDTQRVLIGFEDRVSVAASNGPNSTIISGEPAALDAILEQLRRGDIFCRLVAVDFAAHSPQMEPLRQDFLTALAELLPRSVTIPIYSSVTGQVRNGADFDARYWVRNMREPVLFSAAVQSLVRDGHDIFLEISPHPILLSALQQGFHHFGQDCVALPSLRREENEGTVLLGSLGALYTLGYPVDWDLIYPTGGRCVPLPSYPWQRERHWFEPPAENGGARTYDSGTVGHSLLGQHFHSPHEAGSHFWETVIERKSTPRLDDHRIEGVAVLPASAYLEMALAAAAEVFGARSVTLDDIEFHRALFVPDDEARRLQVVLIRDKDGAGSFHIYSRADETANSDQTWMLHATGRINPQPDDGDASERPRLEAPAQSQARLAETISGQEYYRKLGEAGVHYGPFFRNIVRIWRDDEEALGEVHGPEWSISEIARSPLHPAILDAGLQIFGAAVAARTIASDRQEFHLPTRIGHLRIHGRAGDTLWSHARVDHRQGNATTGDVRFLDDEGHVVAEIRDIRFESLGDGALLAAAEQPDEWLYEFQWRPKERTAEISTGPDSRAAWLIFADRSGVGDALAALLSARGERGILIAPGDSYEQTDDAHYRIRPDEPEDIRRLFESASMPDRPGHRPIVHLWSLDAASPGETTVASLDIAHKRGIGNVLLVAQELARTEFQTPSRLWLITQGVQAVEGEASPISVAQSPLWGFGRVIAQEHPTIWGGLVDLEPGDPSPAFAARQLGDEIADGRGEDQIAFRRGQRFVGRLVRHRPSTAKTPAPQWRRDGAYLISGGLGDLGLLVARWMVEQGARRLILLGRSKLPPRSAWNSIDPGTRVARQVSAIRNIESLGASVHLASVDVADEAELGGFLEGYRAEGWPAIRGVVHAAGVLLDGLVTQLDAAALNNVLRPKAQGGWLLHHLLRDQPLDFFVMFSSAGSVLGQPGQGNYAAANAFLDALAHHRISQGQPALSIDWGAWIGEGFADSVGGKRLAARLALLGIGGIAPPRALEALGRLLKQGAAQVVAVPIDWKRYRQVHPEGLATPLLSELVRESAEIVPPAGRTSEKRDAILAAEPAQRRPMLQTYLGEQVARVLGINPSQLEIEQPLSNLGLDSLMAVELKNRIAVDLGVNVPIARFLQGFSVDHAVAQILDQLASGTADSTKPLASAIAPAADPRDAGHLLANLDQLSDNEVDSLLLEMMREPSARAIPIPDPR